MNESVWMNEVEHLLLFDQKNKKNKICDICRLHFSTEHAESRLAKS